ncbi:hypothetical protein BC939DRAFT_174990 [Gamsiella multidivaricata]|uniref:uncharacterized protein n=1 Tax=Gamsiella multidivaricata TaxID=101098 RepID=UPI00221FFBA0|nr:uncharacterized protein BC939DRAFT_174990 [Gamsiella multidivaricata]KAI7822625.1 hypothetical protein BC939DRAFT_174990 [Gamsiella multidivaricata]
MMTTASAPFTSSSIAGPGSLNATYNHITYHNSSTSNNSHRPYSGSALGSPGLPTPPSYPSTRVGELRRSSVPMLSTSTPSSSNMEFVQHKREPSVDRRMTISHPVTNNHVQYPPVPSSYYSAQPGSRASWAGYSSNYNDGGGFFHRGPAAGHDVRDDHHHAPIHGSFHPVSNSSINSLDDGHQEGLYASEYLHGACNDQHGYPTDGMRNNSTSGMQDSGSMTMTKHRNNSISSNASQSSSSSMTQANKHPCKFPTCGWSFKRFEHLKRHMLVHTKERPFVCDFHGCEKSFSRTSFENAMPGPLSGTPGSAGDRGSIVDSHSGGMGGGDHAHHRHSIAGYPSFSDSRPPLQSQNNYSHGLPTPVHTNQSSNGGSRSARSSYYCPSDEQPDFDTKSSASSSSFGLSTT